MTSLPDLAAQVAALDWYHTIDLGRGVVTPGLYDHRPYLANYALPDDLSGKSALDVGAASGFFAFELERRGAHVTATELPDWQAHDFSPLYQHNQSIEQANRYLHQPFEVARAALGSRVERKLLRIQDLSPETIGRFDIVFCGSLLVHLTDPIQALWRIASVTTERAIIATVIARNMQDQPVAQMTGFPRGDTWWVPTRRCLELMVASAGFAGVEWVSEFALDHRDGTPGPYHGVLHAWNTRDGWGPNVISAESFAASDTVALRDPEVAWLMGLVQARDREIGWLRDLVQGYEQGWYMRTVRFLRGLYRPSPAASDAWRRR